MPHCRPQPGVPRAPVALAESCRGPAQTPGGETGHGLGSPQPPGSGGSLQAATPARDKRSAQEDFIGTAKCDGELGPWGDTQWGFRAAADQRRRCGLQTKQLPLADEAPCTPPCSEHHHGATRGCHFLSLLPPLPGAAAGLPATLAPTGALPGGHRPRGAGGGLTGRGRCCRTWGGLVPLQGAGGEQLLQVGGERWPVQVWGVLRGGGHGRGAAARLQKCPHGGGEGTQGTGHGPHAPGQGCQVLVGPAVSPQQAGGDLQELGDLLRV